MTAPALLALLLSASPPPLSVLCPDFSAEGLSPQAAGALVDRFATELASPELKVMTSRDLERVLGLERQKQLLGCGEENASCLAELAGALGTGVLVSGSVVKVGSRFTVTIRATRLPGGEPVSSASARVDSEDALSDWLDQQAATLRRALVPESASSAPVPVTAWAPWLVVGAGGAAGVAGGVLYGLSRGDVAALESPTPTTNIDAVAAQGRTREQLGAGLMIGGATAIAAGVTWFLLPRSRAPVVIAVSADGVTVAGVLP